MEQRGGRHGLALSGGALTEDFPAIYKGWKNPSGRGGVLGPQPGVGPDKEHRAPGTMGAGPIFRSGPIYFF